MKKPCTRCEVLEHIAADLHWLARRYVEGRQSYATGLFNDHTRRLRDMGVGLQPIDGTIWARDAKGRAYDGLTDEEAGMGDEPGIPVKQKIAGKAGKKR